MHKENRRSIPPFEAHREAVDAVADRVGSSRSRLAKKPRELLCECARTHLRRPQADISRKAPEMPGTLTLAELDEAIAEVRANLRDLVEQETARSGANDENRGDDLIAAQEAKLQRLLDEREAITG
jgi:hypothetical protein